jgi:parallel beta-helix repeat protein
MKSIFLQLTFRVLIFLTICIASLAAEASSYGPQASITCPTNSVAISPGTSIQSIVNAYTGATTFCIKAGTHYLRSSILPRTGNTFIGEFGAILDGAGWSTTDEIAAAFSGAGDIDNVTIKNLVIRNMPHKGIWGSHLQTANWIVEHNDLSYNKYGVVLSAGAIIRNNYIHHNTVAGYTIYMTNLFPGTVARVEGNEIAYNGGGYAQKAMDSGPIIWRGNWMHHNVWAGLWNDGDGNGSIIEDNIIEDNDAGIHWELSVGGTIRRNILRRNKDSGIFLSTSRDTLIEDNILEDNFRGITIFINCYSTTQGWAWGADMRNNTIRNNTIKMSTMSGEVPALFSYASPRFDGSGTQVDGCTDQQVLPYSTNSKNNWFVANKYFVPDLNAWYWIWAPQTKNFVGWQALGQDTTGSVQLASNYSPAPASTPAPTPIPTAAPVATAAPTPAPSSTQLTLSSAVGPAGSQITISYSGIANPTAYNWIGIFQSGSSNFSWVSWIYAGSCTQTSGISLSSGTCMLTLPTTAGEYDIRLFDSGYTVLAFTSVTVHAQSAGLDTIKPITNITDPASGTIVGRKSVVTVRASASDNVGITKVEFLVDNSVVCTLTAPPFICSFKTDAKPKAYYIQTRAYDAAGNMGVSAIVKVGAQ